ATRFAQGVEFVDKYDARSTLFGLLEHVANAGGSHADKHFDKVGTTEAEEGNSGFARHGLAEQSLTGTRRPDEQDSLGNTSPQTLIPFGILKEVDHFAKF